MAEKVNVVLLRPLNGDDIGTERQYDRKDAKRLADRGVVKIITKKANARAPKVNSGGDAKPAGTDDPREKAE